jgi:hypothetical protein
MHDENRILADVERVSCLECGLVYGKPARGGTRNENPGCPGCGYVGWIAVRDYVAGSARRGIHAGGARKFSAGAASTSL